MKKALITGLQDKTALILQNYLLAKIMKFTALFAVLLFQTPKE